MKLVVSVATIILFTMILVETFGFHLACPKWLKPVNSPRNNIGRVSNLRIPSRGAGGFRLKFEFDDDTMESSGDEVNSLQPFDDDESQWEQIYAALQAYFRSYGNLNVDAKFAIQNEDFSWPENVRGLNLGLQVLAIQCGRYVKYHPERKALLDHLNFPWQPSDQAYPDAVKLVDDGYFESVFAALDLYKEHVDSTLKVNKTYLIPPEPPWPSDLFFLPLGNVCMKLRENKNVLQVLSPSKVERLNNLGFPWFNRRELINEENFNHIFNALLQYKNLYGHMRVPKTFEVLANSTDWKPEFWGLKLGSRVHSIRMLGSYTLNSPERKAKLTEAGFDWTPPPPREADFRRKKYKYLTKRDRTQESNTVDAERKPVAVSVRAFVPKVYMFDGSTSNLYDLPWKIQQPHKPLPSSPLIDAAKLVDREENRTMHIKHPFRRLIEAKEAEPLMVGDPTGVKKINFNPFEINTRIHLREQRAHKFIEKFYDNFNDPYHQVNYETPGWYDTDVGYHLVDSPLFTDEERNKLYQVKHQVLDFDQFWWDDVVDAMTIYKRNFGHLTIPPEFKVTEEMLEMKIGFTMRHYDMKLGEIRAQFRSGDIDGYDDPIRRPVLDRLGFDWGDMRHHLRFRYYPLVMIMTMRFGHHLVDPLLPDFVMPADEIWPEWMVHAPLGEWLWLVRMQRKVLETFYPDRIQILDQFLRVGRIYAYEGGTYTHWQWDLIPPPWLKRKYEVHPVPELTEKNMPKNELEVKALTKGCINIKIDKGEVNKRKLNELYLL